MMIMPACNKSGFVHYWSGKLPGTLGHIWSLETCKGTLKPPVITVYPWLPYALDNGRFISGELGVEWNEAAFLEMLDRVKWLPKKPIWLVVPDVRRDAKATIEEWHRWESQLRKYRFPLAFAVQNGMLPCDVPESADVVFIGGTDAWRYPLLHQFVALGKPVHVGRVNGDRLWQCHKAGVASCDGSGWFRGDKKQLAKLEYYLQCQAGEAAPPHSGQVCLDLEARLPPLNIAPVGAVVKLERAIVEVEQRSLL